MITGGPGGDHLGLGRGRPMPLLVGLSMAEICSAYPTSAGLCFWAHRIIGTPAGLRSSGGDTAFRLRVFTTLDALRNPTFCRFG